MATINVLGGDLENGSWNASFQFGKAKMFRAWSTSSVDLEKLVSAEIQTEDKLKKMSGSAGWGFVGAIAGGVLTGGLGLVIGGLAGILSGGNKTEVCFSCELCDGRRFLAITDKKTWQRILVLNLKSGSTNIAKVNRQHIDEDVVISSSATLPPVEAEAEFLSENSYTDLEIQQVIQNALNPHKVLVQIKQTKEQLVILLDREDSNYIDYLDVNKTIKNELTKLKLKDIESITVSGRVIKGKSFDFKKLLEPAYDVYLENIDFSQRKKVISVLTTPNLKEISEGFKSVTNIVKAASLKEISKGSMSPRLTEAQAEKLISSFPVVVKMKINKQDAENEQKRFQEVGSEVSLRKTDFYLDSDVPFSVTKEGDPGQIENVLNLSFRQKGTSVKVSRRAGFLKVILESAQEPMQKESIVSVRKDMIRLGINVESIKSMSVVGQKIGAKTPAWEQTLELLYKKDRNNLFIGIGCLSAPLVAIVWFLSSIIFSSPPENTTTTNLTLPIAPVANSCPCNECVYVTDSEWAVMNWSQQSEFKRQIRASGKCTLVVGDPP
jgi:hypothetical protein